PTRALNPPVGPVAGRDGDSGDRQRHERDDCDEGPRPHVTDRTADIEVLNFPEPRAKMAVPGSAEERAPAGDHQSKGRRTLEGEAWAQAVRFRRARSLAGCT